MIKRVTKLRKIRRERGYGSCAKLGAAVGLSPMCVHYWESGAQRPRPWNAERLAAVLQTPIDVLLSPENELEADVVTTPTSKIERQTQTTCTNGMCELYA